MNIAIGSDEAGFELKEIIRMYLQNSNFSIEDYGVYDRNPVLYPDIALKVSEAVVAKKQERGILICGTGIGMAITANKIPGIRAAQCHDTYSAERAQLSNNAQIITLGARVIGPELAKKIVHTWVNLTFKDGSSTSKIQRITEIDRKFRSCEK